MNQSEALYHLQKIDLQLLQVNKRLGEIDSALQNSDPVIQSQNRLDVAQKKLSPQKTHARNLELEIQSTLQKSISTEERLYSGSVKNPKELQEMQQEIISLKKRQSELEDQLLEQMMLVEESEAEVADAQTALEAVTRQWESEHQDLLAERASLQTSSARLQEERKQALQEVLPDSLKVYNTLRAQKGNQPISTLNGSSCVVCGIEQTRAIEQEVQRGQQLVRCQNCGRILVDSRALGGKLK